MIEVLRNLQNVAKIPELKRRLLVTFGLLAAYRHSAHVPTPGVDGEALARFFDSVQGTLLGLVDLFSGGNLRRLTVFALGINMKRYGGFIPGVRPGKKTAEFIDQTLTRITEPLDRGRGCPGHGPADGIAPPDAALRGLPAPPPEGARLSPMGVVMAIQPGEPSR